MKAPPPAPSTSPPRPGPPSDPDLAKYWHARYFMWGSVYDAGIAMDREGWFSATPAAIAVHQAGRLVRSARAARRAGYSSPPLSLTLVDAFCGCGGNAARLAAAAGPGSRVIAVDTHAGRAAAAAANAALVLSPAGAASGGGKGGASLEMVVSDFFTVAPTLAADALFMSPPWGGPAYRDAEVVRLAEDVGGLGVGLEGLIAAAVAAHRLGVKPCIAVFLPRNSSLVDIVAAGAALGLDVEVQREVVNGRVRSVTAYFGAAAENVKGEEGPRG